MQGQMETKNAIITSTMLGQEGHGIFTAMIQLDYGGSGQSFGGYALDQFCRIKDKRLGTRTGMQFIMNLLETLDVESWEKLKGIHVRVKANFSKVEEIGHFLKDQWFKPVEFFAEGFNEEI